MPNDHLSAEQMAAYLDGVVTSAARRIILAHLAHCDACLDEVLAIRELLRDRSPPDKV